MKMELIFGARTYPNMKTGTTCEYIVLLITVGLSGSPLISQRSSSRDPLWQDVNLPLH